MLQLLLIGGYLSHNSQHTNDLNMPINVYKEQHFDHHLNAIRKRNPTGKECLQLIWRSNNITSAGD